MIGDRQQQRHGERRADAGQDADRRAHGDPDGRPQQIVGRQRHEEAVAERGEGVH